MKGRVVRAVFAAAVVAGCGSAWAEISAGTYVQDGLVAQYDGIENAGAGTYDANATTWKDLKGQGGDMSLAGLTSPVWDGKGLSFSAGGQNSETDTAKFLCTPRVLNLGEVFTIQMFCNTGDTAYYDCRRWDVVPYNNQYESWTSSSEGFLERINGANRFSLKPWVSNADIIFSTVVGNKKHRFMIDPIGGTVQSVEGNLASCEVNCRLAFMKTNGKNVPRKDCYSIRVYNRQLTADEVAFNANIDRMRFNGAAEADLTWPESLRLQDGEVQFRVSMTAADGCPVRVNGGEPAQGVTSIWVSPGEHVTLTACPSTSVGFGGWAGDVPASVSANEPTIAWDCTRACALNVVCRKALFVSTTGVDAVARGTRDEPLRTIQYAVDRSADNDWIYVAGGEYDESVTLPVFRNVSGSWNGDFSARDLRNGRTIIKSAATTAPCISIPKAAGTNVLYGLTLTGGSAGIQSRANGGPNDSATYHHVFGQLIITNNVNGMDFNGGWNSVDMSASLIANNSGYGFHHHADHGTKTYFRNCTFASNKQALYRQWIWAQAIETRNCTFIHNGCENYHNGARSYAVNEYDSVHYGNDDLYHYETGLGSDVNTFYLKLYNRHYMFDPKVDAETGVPLSGSPIQGLGGDQSAAGVYEDVYGQPWNGVYDLGCAKGPDAPAAKVPELWVAPDGDDAAAGTDAEHPLKSINEAFARLAENGTVHLADGTYEEMVAVCVPGAKLVGSSVKRTILRPETDGTAMSGSAYKTWNFAVGIFAPDVTVSNLTIRAATVGVYAWSASDVAGARTTVAACNVRENVHGIVMQGSGPRNAYSHLQVRDNACYGIYTVSGGAFDNLLVADNGGTGIYQHANSQRPTSGVVNCTVVDNGGWGWYNGEGSPNTVRFINTIFGGNASGGITQKANAKAVACCFWSNGEDGETHWGAGKSVDTATIFTDPKVDATATLRGHLAEASPCSQTGVDLTTYKWDISPAVPVADDLDYVDRIPDKMDMGCYDSPETINGLAGLGYHVVNVAATPNGYGEPDPNYGRTLMKDGLQTLDVSCTLSTDVWDGRRNQPLETGVRARYLGYDVINDETGATVATSDTAESYEFYLLANTTFRIKWVVEDLLTLSGGQPGCKVKVNGGEAAETLHAWVPRGEPVTVTFVPSDDWALSAWGGDVPSSVDPKATTLVWTSDGPRTLEPTLRGVHYVSLGGSDDNDGTRARPWRTIGHAIADASTKEYDEVKVQGGLYEESVTNSAKMGGVPHLVLTGGWNADWERDLVGSRTVITPPADKRRKLPCIYMDTKFNTIHGFDLTGGSAGIVAAPNCSGTNDSAEDHSELACLIVTNNVNGLDFSKSFPGVALASSLIADNEGYGYYHFANLFSDRGARDYIYNCTFARNGAEGIRRGTRGSYAAVRNCVFDGNGVGVRIYMSGYPMSVYASCFGNSVTSSFMSVSIAAGGDSPATFYRGAMFAPPQLDAAYAPTADSPFLGRGENLVQDAIYGFGTDVYGRLWDGVWDYGCIKSAFAARTPAAVQYVDEKGDDLNDGLSANSPRRTLSAAVAAIVEGGTIHVGPGRYEPVAIDRANVKLLGAGAGRSFIAMTNAVTARTAVVPAVMALADGFEVSGFTLCNAHAGVYNPGNTYCKNPVFRGCNIRNCNLGVKTVMGPNLAGHHQTFDRCRVMDNDGTGFYLQEPAYITSTLIARNGGHGIYINPWDTFDQSYAVNCTIVSNKSYGVVGANGAWTRGITVNNSIISGHSVGVHRTSERWSSGLYIYNTVLNNATNLWYVYDASKEVASRGGVYVDANSPNVEADPLLRATASRYAHPEEGSPALGAGGLRNDISLRPTLDLDGRKIKYSRPLDCGCYQRDPTGLKIIVK